MSMDPDFPHAPCHGSTIRSFTGCWTCRLRRKKCDEKYPTCDNCTALLITCYYDQNKPEWMDGGTRQEEMAEQVKREVKEKAHRRREGRATHVSGDRASITEATNGKSIVLPQDLLSDLAITRCTLLGTTPEAHSNRVEALPEAPTTRLQRETDCTRTSKDARERITFSRSDTILVMFYIENVLPFLFPFYRPSILQGGKAWILELMISSPVVRQATLCQSSYFFSLARGINDGEEAWETVLTQTRDAFEMLRQALQVITGSDITEHLHGAVRIMASIMQVQRFEIAILSFDNCQAHLNAALALFGRLLDSPGASQSLGFRSSFHAMMNKLGPSSWIFPTQRIQVQSAEQSACHFSSSLLILDDIIASTVLQEQPRLYEYHRGLLGDIDETEPLINLETIIGCQNWTFLHIGEVAVLDAWKHQSKRAGNLDVIELVYRATVIKNSLKDRLARLETDPGIVAKERDSLLDAFTIDFDQQSKTSAKQISLITRVWAHAAFIYLFVVVSGWQPASNDVRYHVNQIIELLGHQMLPSVLLRTMVWPFCVAGCLAEPEQEGQFRGIVEALQPPCILGTVRKALEIMEGVWRNRDAGDAASRDLATCFRSQGNLVLLV